MAVIHYPKDILAVTPTEFKTHIDRLLRSTRLVSPSVEYVWAREWQRRRKTPHIHLLLSVKVEAKTLRKLWVNALRSTHEVIQNPRSPYVGYCSRQLSHVQLANYMAKISRWRGTWKIHRKFWQKEPPDGAGYTSGGAWNASHARGRLAYNGDAIKMCVKVRSVNRIGKSIERAKGLSKGRLRATDRKGIELFGTGRAMLQLFKSEPENWGIKEAQAFGKICVVSSTQSETSV